MPVIRGRDHHGLDLGVGQEFAIVLVLLRVGIAAGVEAALHVRGVDIAEGDHLGFGDGPGVLDEIPAARAEADVAEAIGLCLDRDVSGAFNLAAKEVVSLPDLVRHGRRFVVPVPLAWVRGLVALARRLGNRDEFSWLDEFDTPLTVDCTRAERLLGWRSVYSPWQAQEDLVSGAIQEASKQQQKKRHPQGPGQEQAEEVGHHG